MRMLRKVQNHDWSKPVWAEYQLGYPSPSQDYSDTQIDLTEMLIRDELATFIVRVSGDSMEGAGIFDGDELIVDRSIEPQDGHIVVAVLDNEMTVKRLHVTSTG